MEDPQTNRSFFYYAKHSVCEPCRDNFEYQIKPNLRNKEPFAFDWYRKYVSDTLDKAVQKGRA